LPGFVQNFFPSTIAGNAIDAGPTDKGKSISNDATASRPGGKGGDGVVAVTVATAELSTLPLVERTYGIVKSPAVAAINARIASQITEIHIKDGQLVKAGDPLVTLDDRLFQAQLAKDQAVLAKDQAVEVSSAADLLRAQDLAKKGAGTEQAYDQALAAQKSANAVVDADQATVESDQVQLEYTKISAPISGRLGAIQTAVGNLVGGGSSSGSSSNLMTITQVMPLKVTFQLPERVLSDIRAAIQAGQPVPVRVLQSGTTSELESGNLDFIDSAVDTTSGTIAMSAMIDNDQLSLWPGQYVDVEVQRGVLTNAVVVPTVAVQQGQSGSFVWLVGNDDAVAARLVTVAHNEGDKSAISAGLATGDKVVVEGQIKLKDGSRVKIADLPDNRDASATAPSGRKKKS
jgi:multidrug efflux system membrane fusion protein